MFPIQSYNSIFILASYVPVESFKRLPLEDIAIFCELFNVFNVLKAI